MCITLGQSLYQWTQGFHSATFCSDRAILWSEFVSSFTVLCLMYNSKSLLLRLIHIISSHHFIIITSFLTYSQWIIYFLRWSVLQEVICVFFFFFNFLMTFKAMCLEFPQYCISAPGNQIKSCAEFLCSCQD